MKTVPPVLGALLACSLIDAVCLCDAAVWRGSGARRATRAYAGPYGKAVGSYGTLVIPF